MVCVGVDTCDFVTYLCTPDGKYLDSYVEMVKRDNALIERIVRSCHSFYKKHILPLLAA